jgi:hypothetical protein
VHDSEDAIVSEIRILQQLSEWKYVVPLLLKALSINLSGLLYVQGDWLRIYEDICLEAKGRSLEQPY